MKVMQIPAFGINNLQLVNTDTPRPDNGQVLVRLNAASINYRDYQIIQGEFTPNVPFPLIPLSDGAGEIVALGEGVDRVQIGDKVTPLFFPRWLSGEALNKERSVSSGLEVPGVLREFGVYDQQAVTKVASHLTDEEAACFPCAGLTAWNSLVTIAGIRAGGSVLVQGTGGVGIFALLFAKALGANVIVISSSNDKLARARALGADHCINYKAMPDWGQAALELTNGRGVDVVVEIGGSGTLANSAQAIRHGGHIAIIGYLAGAKIELTVFSLITKNAHWHGLGVGNRDQYEQMMAFVDKHRIRPVIDKIYEFEQTGQALVDLVKADHFGKLVVRI
jgi:NADPH:quinone reductase-like Zn-dependent oxidoreductase